MKISSNRGFSIVLVGLTEILPRWQGSPKWLGTFSDWGGTFPKIDYIQEIKVHKPCASMTCPFPTFNTSSPILTSTLNLFSALYYLATNCTIILQLLQTGEQGNPSVGCSLWLFLTQICKSSSLCLLPIPLGCWLLSTDRPTWSTEWQQSAWLPRSNQSACRRDSIWSSILNHAVICRPWYSSCEIREIYLHMQSQKVVIQELRGVWSWWLGKGVGKEEISCLQRNITPCSPALDFLPTLRVYRITS